MRITKRIIVYNIVFPRIGSSRHDYLTIAAIDEIGSISSQHGSKITCLQIFFAVVKKDKTILAGRLTISNSGYFDFTTLVFLKQKVVKKYRCFIKAKDFTTPAFCAGVRSLLADWPCLARLS